MLCACKAGIAVKQGPCRYPETLKVRLATGQQRAPALSKAAAVTGPSHISTLAQALRKIAPYQQGPICCPFLAHVTNLKAGKGPVRSPYRSMAASGV